MKTNFEFISPLSRVLGVLLATAVIAKWRIINFTWHGEADAIAILGSAFVATYALGSVIGAWGLIARKWSGCVGAYCAVLGGTMIGVSAVPGLPYLVPAGIARTYAVIALNAAAFAAVVFVQVGLRRARSHKG